MRPLLFLDVDGVLNTWPENEEGINIVTEHGRTVMPPGTPDRVFELLQVFEPVWATAWRGVAHDHHRAKLALGEPWPYVDYSSLKLPEIIKRANGRPWAWVDDDAMFELRQLHSAFAEIPDTLIVIPEYRLGLTDEHVRELLEFAEGVS